MKKFVAILFMTALIAVNALGQDPPPTLRIVTESPGLPSELFYGNIKVKPMRFRPGTTTPITIADYDFFIQQQYVDFLRRFPEPSGLQFYLNILNGCNSNDTECVKYTRGALAANFFRSPEFQRKGSFVMNLYMTSLGQRPSTDAELADPARNTFERPHYSEFMADVQSISDPNDDQAVVNAKKDALTVAWLQRAEIQALYPNSMSNAAFVQKLSQVSGLSLSQTYVDRLNNGESRAQVLRSIVESQEIVNKFYKQAFVTMEYFGFQRRDPDLGGYVFHNNRYKQLEALIPPDLVENFIVRGFIESPEYINRF